jgi:hypothetical protein
MGFHVPTGSSISAKTVCIFAAIGALLGGADGGTAAGFQAAIIFAIVGGLIGGVVGIFVGGDSQWRAKGAAAAGGSLGASSVKLRKAKRKSK